jgi:hypothetical protein
MCKDHERAKSSGKDAKRAVLNGNGPTYLSRDSGIGPEQEFGRGLAIVLAGLRATLG